VVEGFLGAGGEVLEFNEWPFLADDDGVAGTEVFGFLELLPDLGSFEGEIGGKAEFSTGLDNVEGLGSAGFVGNDDIGIARRSECRLELGGSGRPVVGLTSVRVKAVMTGCCAEDCPPERLSNSVMSCLRRAFSSDSARTCLDN
jgi:hypothetical protein